MEQFQLFPKQREARDLLNDPANEDILLVGGSRSTKTSLIIRNIILRAQKLPSRHLIARKAFNHVKTSIWHDTFPKMMRGFFPGVKYHPNKSDWFITIPCAKNKLNPDGDGESQIWFGGTDDKERVEKILGNEYSTIFTNEVSQMSYDSITTLRTRLAENSGLMQKFYYDCNPPSKAHWSYQEFIKKLVPGTREASQLASAWLLMNPMDNPLLSDAYMRRLMALPKRQRDRYLYGLFLSDVEGALWTDQMISDARTLQYGELVKTVIAVDPAVTHQENSDETGIIAAGLDVNGTGVILEDHSIKASTLTWAQRVVNAYNKHEANCVVVEVNQGGDLVRDALKNIDRSIKVVDVRASKGKFARAEPVSELYELGSVAHAKDFVELDGQLTEYVPLNCKKSPDRLDALVWALTHLMIKKPKTVRVG